MAVDLSIVIPCKDHLVELQHCLKSLANQRTLVDFEVIVVSSETDDALKELAAGFPSVQLIQSEVVLFPGAARNLGAGSAKASKICFLDADCIAEKGWVDEAFNALNNGLVLAGGAIQDLYPFHPIASADNRLQFVDFPAHRPPGAFGYFPACNLAVSKDAFENAGKFREDLELGEDTLLTTRICEQWGQKMRFIPSMVVRHSGRKNMTGFLLHQKRFGYYRGLLGLRSSQSLRWLGTRPYLGWVVAMRRLGYICLRVLQWNILDLPRFVLQLPILLIGLVSWTEGFYEGVRQQNMK